MLPLPRQMPAKKLRKIIRKLDADRVPQLKRLFAGELYKRAKIEMEDELIQLYEEYADCTTLAQFKAVQTQIKAVQTFFNLESLEKIYSGRKDVPGA